MLLILVFFSSFLTMDLLFCVTAQIRKKSEQKSHLGHKVLVTTLQKIMSQLSLLAKLLKAIQASKNKTQNVFNVHTEKNIFIYLSL